MVGGLRSAAPEFTSTIEAGSCITGAAAWIRCIAPKKLTSKMCFQLSGSASAIRAQSPAWWPFCTRWSSRPKWATACSTTAWQSSRCDRSAVTTSGSRPSQEAFRSSTGLRPSARTSAVTASSRSLRRAASTTSTPCTAKPSAMARPIPGPAPVTIATLPGSNISTCMGRPLHSSGASLG